MAEKTKTTEITEKGKLAVILVRGTVEVTKKIKDTISMLKLNRKNTCAVIENNPINKGMLTKVKDYVAWGEINDGVFKKLVEERGQEFKEREKDSKGKYAYKKFLEFGGRKYKKTFHLNPPRKGFGRKGVKISFKAGGALGYRGEKINDLIVRMI